MTDEEIAEFREGFSLFDVDGGGDNGSVDFPEYLTMMVRKRNEEKDQLAEVIAAFKEFDTDGSGVVPVAKLKQVMTNLGEKLTDEELDEVIFAADVDGDGNIKYEELARDMTGAH